MEWTNEQLLDGLITKKRFAEQNNASVYVPVAARLSWWQCSCGTEMSPRLDQCPQCGRYRDSKRIDYLEELIRNCPHAQITFCDDPDCEEGALGFMIRVEGCRTSEVCAPTLREVIDKDIAANVPPLSAER
jgi:hypothetical protein